MIITYFFFFQSTYGSAIYGKSTQLDQLLDYRGCELKHSIVKHCVNGNCKVQYLNHPSPKTLILILTVTSTTNWNTVKN